MPSTTSYKRGDVVLIPFPFTDLTSSKRRPALIISSEVFNSTHDDVIVIGITSQIPARLSEDEFLIPATALSAAGLPKASLVKLSKVVTLHQQLIVKRLGAIPESVLAEVRERVQNQF
jgi:mRNA interferase MazF